MDLNFVLKSRAQGSTLQEIATILGVSKQRIHQICAEYNMSKPKTEKLLSELEHRKARFKGNPDLYTITAARFRRKKQNCKQGKWEFTIDFWDIDWPTHCPILGLELEYSSAFDKRVEASVSFDRIDSTKGYIPGNVQILSWRANRIKNDGTAEEHRKIADYLDKSVV